MPIPKRTPAQKAAFAKKVRQSNAKLKLIETMTVPQLKKALKDKERTKKKAPKNNWSRVFPRSAWISRLA